MVLPLAAGLFVVGCWLDAAPAFAQGLQSQQSPMLRFPDRPKLAAPSPAAARRQANSAPMLLQANEMQYDYTNQRVSAVGNVQVYYAGSTLESQQGRVRSRRTSDCTPKATCG